MKPLVALAPAKVNLCLHVGSRRPDGLHELCSLLQSVTFADELVLEEGDTEDEVICPGVRGTNLAALAIAAFRDRFGWSSPPVRITISKRIPVAAGLGGGSADAAAVLRLARAASGIDPPRRELEELAMDIGADVPSQLEPGLALARGAGEDVERLAHPGRLAFILLFGGGALRTANVYARADELGLAERDLDALAAELRSAVERGRPLAPLMTNDLERAAISLEPAVQGALALLHESGAEAALVSGSGSAAFGLFESGLDAQAARSAIAERWPGETVLAASVDASYGAPSPLDAGARDRSGIGQ